MRQRPIRVNAKRRRCFNANEILALRQGLHADFREYLAARIAVVDAAKDDTTKFFNEVCRLKPYTYQLTLEKLYQENQFLAVRWPRHG